MIRKAMQVIADLQLHSKYSRAVSPAMNLSNISFWAKRKGIDLVATGDWTHPLWMKEIQENLEEMGNGLLKFKKSSVVSLQLSGKLENNNLKAESGRQIAEDPLFLLATEVSCIYSQNGKGRRVHTLIWVPSIASALKINKEMTRRGCNLLSDGRPIIPLTSMELAELVLTIEPVALIIPAHCWTPWFSVYGSKSGFDSIDEAYGSYAKYIYAVETGLSSNPSMNWRIGELDHRAIVSFSDAHSGPKLGRECTIFDLSELSYDAVTIAIKEPSLNTESRILNSEKKTKNQDSVFGIQDSHIAYTIEFYPEEGKYHWSGHRACSIRRSPKETEKDGKICPVCGRPLTQGVEERIGELAGRSEEGLQLSAIRIEDSRNLGVLTPGIASEVRMIGSKTFPNRPPFAQLVPLQEIIADSIGSPVSSPKVQSLYECLTDTLGGEFAVLLRSTHTEIELIAGKRVAMGVDKVRSGDIVVEPGYDGVFGIVKLW